MTSASASASATASAAVALGKRCDDLSSSSGGRSSAPDGLARGGGHGDVIIVVCTNVHRCDVAARLQEHVLDTVHQRVAQLRGRRESKAAGFGKRQGHEQAAVAAATLAAAAEVADGPRAVPSLPR